MERVLWVELLNLTFVHPIALFTTRVGFRFGSLLRAEYIYLFSFTSRVSMLILFIHGKAQSILFGYLFTQPE